MDYFTSTFHINKCIFLILIQLSLILQARNSSHFLNKILWTDESTFTRTGVTNTRNLHLWAQENPHGVRPARFQKEFSVNIWAGLINDKLVGPIEFPRALNGQLFLEFLTGDFFNLLDKLPLYYRRHLRLQLDGCPAHFAIRVRQHLNENFPGWIGRGAQIAWPPRSPDLTPLDFFLWGYLKEKVYATTVHSREELVRRIFTASDELKTKPEMIRKATLNVKLRAATCLQNGGGHFENKLK